MPRPLPDGILEEVLCRLPPHEPAELVRAALVSRRWCRLVSDPGFRRRFGEFHRSLPMLGMICNLCDFDGYSQDDIYKIDKARFIPMIAFCTPRTDLSDMRVLDVRHGRVLCENGSVLTVWDPITGKVRKIPFPGKKANVWTAAVLCSAAAGACDHLDCHNGPFLVVCLCINTYGQAFVYTYSSNAAAWSKPIGPQQTYLGDPMSSVLVGNALYLGIDGTGSKTLKYNLELHQMSMIKLPSSLPLFALVRSVLTTAEDGGLGLVTRYDSQLYEWSRKDTHEVDDKWERRIIEPKTVFPVDVVVTKHDVIGFGGGIVFMRMGDEVYTIDLKTYKVKKVYEGRAHNVFPFMSFYTPASGGTCIGEGPSATCSSA